MKDIYYYDGRFHTCNKSIARFNVFRKDEDKERFLNVVEFYNDKLCNKSFSWALRMKDPPVFKGLMHKKDNQYVNLIAYCIMPDHYHLVFKSLASHEEIYKFINNVENSYTRFYNTKYNRKGPLWQSDYRNVEVKSNEQLLHLTGYVHLNPTTASLVLLPEEYLYSSYGYYCQAKNYVNLTDILISNASDYIHYINNNIEHQRHVKLIRKLLLE